MPEWPSFLANMENLLSRINATLTNADIRKMPLLDDLYCMKLRTSSHSNIRAFD